MPDPVKLVREIEAHQRRMDELRENYTFNETVVTDDLNPDGSVRHTSADERAVFFVNGYRIARLTKKDGRELNSEERKSEEERVRKEIEKDLKAPRGHAYNRRGENAGVGDILPIMKISNARRTSVQGRSTLAYDFIGDPRAKAHGIAENAARKITGTVWIDEADHEVSRLEARFDDTFRLGAGFLISVQKGTSLTFEQTRIGAELWMPSVSEIHLAARELLVRGVRQNIHIRDSGFRRFDTDVKQVVSPPQ